MRREAKEIIEGLDKEKYGKLGDFEKELVEMKTEIMAICHFLDTFYER
jgi:hypothetical protein